MNRKKSIINKISSGDGKYLFFSIFISSVIFVGAWIYASGFRAGVQEDLETMPLRQVEFQNLTRKVLPSEGILLPVSWGDLGLRLVKAGVIDEEKFRAIYRNIDFADEYESLLLGNSEDKIRITANNSGYLLNLFWALGLSNKNQILENGEMMDSKYGGAGVFASTGGWAIAVGNSMDHYSRHEFLLLSPEEQDLVDKLSRGIYRPCCGNPAHFPDCNHGMAMLGFLELMASKGISENEMLETALTLNSFWFPDAYLTIAAFVEENGISWDEVNSKEILGESYSSARGHAKIARLIDLPQEILGIGTQC